MKDELNIEIFSSICQITSLYLKRQINEKSDQEKAFQDLNKIVEQLKEQYKSEFEPKTETDEQLFPHDEFCNYTPILIENQDINQFHFNVKEHLKLQSLERLILFDIKNTDKKFVIFESFKIICILFFYEFLLAQFQGLLSKEIQKKILDNCSNFQMVKESFQQPEQALNQFFDENWLNESAKQIVEVFLKIIKAHLKNFTEQKQGHKSITNLLFNRKFNPVHFKKIDIFSIIRMNIEILGVSLGSYKQSLFMRSAQQGLKAKSIEISQNSQNLFNCPFVISQEIDQIKIYLYITYSDKKQIDQQNQVQNSNPQPLSKLKHSVKSQKTIVLPSYSKQKTFTKTYQNSINSQTQSNNYRVKDSLMEQNWFDQVDPVSQSQNQRQSYTQSNHQSFSVNQNRRQSDNTQYQQPKFQIFDKKTDFFKQNNQLFFQIDKFIQNYHTDNFLLNQIRIQDDSNYSLQRRYYSQEELQRNQNQNFQKQQNSYNQVQTVKVYQKFQIQGSSNHKNPPTRTVIRKKIINQFI